MIHRRRPTLVAAAALLAAASAAAFPARVELDLGQGQSLSLVLVHGGTFRQGSPATEAGRSADEAPRDVTVGHDFYLGEVPVLVGQYARFVGATGYRTESETGRSGGYGFDGHALVQRPAFNWRAPGFEQTDGHPAVILTFDDAQRFTAWASSYTGRVVRLPTEAEWELACRAGTDTAWYNGGSENAALAAGWFREGSGNGTRPTRQRAANGLGLYDMVGHVQQWVADWYAPYPPGAAVDPWQTVAASPPGEPARRAMRGGSWLRHMNSGRCAARSRATPGSRNADTGFRVAVDAFEPAPVAATAPVFPSPPPIAPEAPTQSAAPTDGGDHSCFGIVAVVLGLLGLGTWLSRRALYGAVKLVSLPDGFLVQAPPAYRGLEIRCRYEAGGRASEVLVTYEHSTAGQFVYTGATPTALSVLGVVGSRSSGRSGGGSARSSTHRHHPHHDAGHSVHSGYSHHDAGHSGYSHHDAGHSSSSWSGHDPPAY